MDPTNEQTQAELDAAYLPMEADEADDCDAAYDAWTDDQLTEED